MNFSSFVGNEKVKSELSYLLDSGRLPHAILLEGDEGVGKHTLAKEIAANLFCRESKNNACYDCPQCNKVMNDIHPDLFTYIAPNRVAGFHIETVRDVIGDVYMQPNEADYKVYILGNCQSMNVSAQNAMLKILEEPPKYAIFILTATTKSTLIETVLSRCVTFKINGVGVKQGADYICEHNADVSFEDASNAVSVCGGNIGKALLTLNDGKLSKIAEYCTDIANALISDNEYDLLIACSVFEKEKSLFVESLTLLKTIFRDAMLCNVDTQVVSGQIELAKSLSRKISREKLIKLIGVCDNAVSLANMYANNALIVTKLCYELRRALDR